MADDGETSRINWTVIAVIWLVVSALLVLKSWPMAMNFSLDDPDDNMRLMQVRNWLAGAGWFDVRQYRMEPPPGFSMHWSRLVDLPIAGTIVAASPIFGRHAAEALAISIAPLLTLASAMAVTALLTARLAGPRLALPAAVLMLAASVQAMGPLRIDHHAWQSVLTLVMIAGCADRKQGRGGITTGLAAAAGLAIGLEILPQIVAAAVFILLRWIANPDQAARLQRFGLAIGLGTSAAFGAFVAPARYGAAYCDALSPVYLSAALLGAAIAIALPPLASRLSVAGRVAAAVAAGGVVMLLLLKAWPHCAAGPYAMIDPDLQRIWLSNVSEAQPLAAMSGLFIGFILLPLVLALLGGLVGFRNATDRDGRAGWLAYLLFLLVSLALLFWQIRAATLAIMLAVPGGVALLGHLLPRVRAWQARLPPAAGRVMLVGAFALVGALGWLSVRTKPRLAVTDASAAGVKCTDPGALAALDTVPKGLIIAELELGPAILVHSSQSVLAGPYHRNAEPVIDTLHFFAGSAAGAKAIAIRRRADYVVACKRQPAQDGDDFAALLARGEVPDWLHRVVLPAKIPFMLFHVEQDPVA